MKSVEYVTGWLVLCLSSHFCWTSPPSCQPAEQGKPYSLICQSKNARSAYWNISMPSESGKPMNVICDGKTESACSKLPENVFVSYEQKDSGSLVGLLITSVSLKDDGTVFKCFSSDGVDKQEVSSCKLLVYHKPEIPECHTEKEGDNRVRVTCSATSVFPNLACRFEQQDAITGEKWAITQKFLYEIPQQKNGTKLLHDVSCSAILDNLQKGSYQFLGKLSPAWTQDQFLSELSVPAAPTIPISISDYRAYVKIEPIDQWPVRLCEESTKVTSLSCTAYGFESEPVFEWFINGERVQGSVPTVAAKDGNYLVTKDKLRSVLTFRALPQHVGSTILCKGKTSSNSEPFDTVTFSAIWPPTKAPKFTDESGRQLGTLVELTDGQKGHINCEITGGEPRVSKVFVKCYGRGKERIFSDTGNGIARISLDGTESLNGTSCLCSADHKTECYKSVANIALMVRHGNWHTQQAMSQDGGMDSWMYGLIGAAVIAVIVVIAIIGVIVYLRFTRRHRNVRGPRRCPSQENGYEPVSVSDIIQNPSQPTDANGMSYNNDRLTTVTTSWPTNFSTYVTNGGNPRSLTQPKTIYGQATS